MIQILTHRGLEPSNPGFFPESSLEAFDSHLHRGFGIEFDINFSKDSPIVFHDSGMDRITSGADSRQFGQLSLSEIKSIKLGKSKQGSIPSVSQVFHLLEESSCINALHFRGRHQTIKNANLLLNEFSSFPGLFKKIIVFDVRPATAEYLRMAEPRLLMAPSVAHNYDICRYNTLLGNTLVSVEDAVSFRHLFDWVWIDEWDRKDFDSKSKTIYSKDIFQALRSAGFKIALVTPELHATSPGLYGQESHEDAKDLPTLFRRIKEILSLNPDAVCTDYPEEVRKMISSS